MSSTGAKNLLQGDDNGHVGRPCEVSLAPPCPELFCELRGLCRHSYFGPRTYGRSEKPSSSKCTSACFVCNARHTSSRSVQGRAGGAGNSRFLGIGRVSEPVQWAPADVRNLSAEHPPPTQQPRHSSDCDWRNSPERVTGRCTSPSVHACPTPHCGKTQRRPAPHASARTQSSRARGAARGTRPTSGSPCRHRLPAPMSLPRLPPCTRTCAPRMQERPEHTRPRMHPVGPRKQGFLHMAAVRALLWK